MLNFRLDILKNYIMTVKFPNSYVLPYITEDTKFKNVNLFKYKNKYFKLVNNLNDVIKIFRRKTFADEEITKILINRYTNDFKNFKLSDELEKIFINGLTKLFMNNFKLISNDETFPSGTNTFIFNGYKHEFQNFDKLSINLNYQEICKMFSNTNKLENKMTYYFKVENLYFRYFND